MALDNEEVELLRTARKAILTALKKEADLSNSSAALELAEAHAWMVAPGQPHGGGGNG